MKLLLLFSLIFIFRANADVASAYLGIKVENLSIIDLKVESTLVAERKLNSEELADCYSKNHNEINDCEDSTVGIWEKRPLLTIQYQYPAGMEGPEFCGTVACFFTLSIPLKFNDLTTQQLIDLDKLHSSKERQDLANSVFVVSLQEKDQDFYHTQGVNCFYNSEGEEVSCESYQTIHEIKNVPFIVVDYKN